MSGRARLDRAEYRLRDRRGYADAREMAWVWEDYRAAASDYIARLEDRLRVAEGKVARHDEQAAARYDAQFSGPRGDDCCSCHINPPCSFCVDQPDPDADDEVQP